MEKEQDNGQEPVQMSLAESLRERFAEDHYGDVMVVGGGISGIQASLDLAASGFKVFLVDKAPAIGGHMAQLDKTFPTNDCSI
jgi:heterodisulfide reductase subunit A